MCTESIDLSNRLDNQLLDSWIRRHFDRRLDYKPLWPPLSAISSLAWTILMCMLHSAPHCTWELCTIKPSMHCSSAWSLNSIYSSSIGPSYYNHCINCIIRCPIARCWAGSSSSTASTHCSSSLRSIWRKAVRFRICAICEIPKPAATLC